MGYIPPVKGAASPLARGGGLGFLARRGLPYPGEEGKVEVDGGGR